MTKYMDSVCNTGKDLSTIKSIYYGWWNRDGKIGYGDCPMDEKKPWEWEIGQCNLRRPSPQTPQSPASYVCQGVLYIQSKNLSSQNTAQSLLPVLGQGSWYMNFLRSVLSFVLIFCSKILNHWGLTSQMMKTIISCLAPLTNRLSKLIT